MRLSGRTLDERQTAVFILFSYGVTLSFFIDEGNRNYLVLLAAGLGGLMFLTFRLVLERQFLLAMILFAVMALRSLYLDGVVTPFGGADLLYALGLLAIVALLEQSQEEDADSESTALADLCLAILSVIQMMFSLQGYGT